MKIKEFLYKDIPVFELLIRFISWLTWTKNDQKYMDEFHVTKFRRYE